MARAHDIDTISTNYGDYKYCHTCGEINWHTNKACINCGKSLFKPMKEQDANDLLDEWAHDQEYRMEV